MASRAAANHERVRVSHRLRRHYRSARGTLDVALLRRAQDVRAGQRDRRAVDTVPVGREKRRKLKAGTSSIGMIARRKRNDHKTTCVAAGSRWCGGGVRSAPARARRDRGREIRSDAYRRGLARAADAGPVSGADTGKDGAGGREYTQTKQAAM